LAPQLKRIPLGSGNHLRAQHVEIRNSPPPTRPTELRDEGLLDELALALRDVGTWDYSLARGDAGGEGKVRRVQDLGAEINRRGLDPTPRLEQLTAETDWLMTQLYADCKEFPRVLPLVRERDGVRRSLRCPLCNRNELPDLKGIWLCEACMDRVESALTSHESITGVFLFRTYTSEKWCKHANAETTMMALDLYEDVPVGACIACFEEERARRRAVAAA
jgi:hypothetical protein